jgi:hypothetical protein
MKRVTIKTASGKIICSEDTTDPKAFIAGGILDGKWGNPQDILISVDDVTKDKESLESQMKTKRDGLIKDYSALIPRRKERLRMAIDKFILTHFPVDVEEV